MRLRRRLQQAETDLEDAREVLLASYDKLMKDEMEKCEKLAEQRVRKKLSSRKEKKTYREGCQNDALGVQSSSSGRSSFRWVGQDFSERMP